MKKIMVLILTIFSIFLIYRHFDNYKINYVSIGDGLIKGMNYLKQEGYGYNEFIKDYLVKKKRLGEFNNYYYNQSINGLLSDIKKNRTIRIGDKEYFFKKVLRESDILIISVGMEELNNGYDKYNMNNNYKLFNQMYLKIESLVKEIKKYTKGTIIYLGYYNPTGYYDSKVDEFFYQMDIKLNRLMMNNNFNYLDLYELVKGNRYKDDNDSLFLNYKGYERIAESIKFYLR